MKSVKSVKYFVRPEYGQEDVIGPTFGPFDEFIQLTYGDIRVGPDGETIGYRGQDGMYRFCKTYRPHNKEIPIPVRLHSTASAEGSHNCPDWSEAVFSDVVIWAE